MLIDTNRLHFWFEAIRKSTNHIRTLDAFYKGQIKSKEWLIDSLQPFINDNRTVEIHGGWVGVLASLLFQKYSFEKIVSIDIDPEIEETAKLMNFQEFHDKRFDAITMDMCDYVSSADIVINTSCEHISQQQYDVWLKNLKDDSLIVLQSNNYQIDEHIRICENIDHFKSMSNLKVVFEGTLKLPLYDRYMLIGNKNV